MADELGGAKRRPITRRRRDPSAVALVLVALGCSNRSAGRSDGAAADGRTDAGRDSGADGDGGRICPSGWPVDQSCDAAESVECCYDGDYGAEFCHCTGGQWECSHTDCFLCDPFANPVACPAALPDPDAPCATDVSCCYDDGTYECDCTAGSWLCIDCFHEKCSQQNP